MAYAVRPAQACQMILWSNYEYSVKKFIVSERKTVNTYSYFYSAENNVHTFGKFLEDSVMIPQ